MPVLEQIDLSGVVTASLYDFDQARMTINVGGVSYLRGNALRIANLTAKRERWGTGSASLMK